MADYLKVISVQQLEPRSACARWPPRSPRWRAPKVWKRTRAPLRCATRWLEQPRLPKGAVRPREAVLKMAPYSPPTAGRPDKLRLDFNENTVGCSPRVIEFLKQRLDAERPRRLSRIRRSQGRRWPNSSTSQPDQFVFTNGTDEAIQVFINTYVDDGDEVLLLRPAYAMYRFYARSGRAPVFARSITKAPPWISRWRTCWTPITPDHARRADRQPEQSHRHRPVARRPSSASSSARAKPWCSSTKLTSNSPASPRWARSSASRNLFVSRTFSKVYGMAAMRLGCLFSHRRQYRIPAQGAIALQREYAGRRWRRRRRFATPPTSKITWPKCWPRASCCASAWRDLKIGTCRVPRISC